MVAAKVGGLGANLLYKGEFIYENLMMQCNVLHQSYIAGVKKVLLIGTNCTYPAECKQPMKESDIGTGMLGSSVKPYGTAKLAGIEMLKAYYDQYAFKGITACLPNLYGINDNYDTDKSHVVAALIKRIHEAKIQNLDSVIIWGSGKATREFLYTADAVDGIIHVMNIYDDYNEPINIGNGLEVSISELANTIKEVINYNGNLIFDSSKPEGTLRKVYDVSKITKTGWTYKTSLKQGIKLAYNDFINNI
jgi:GDP-L-fucose synthase